MDVQSLNLFALYKPSLLKLYVLFIFILYNLLNFNFRFFTVPKPTVASPRKNSHLGSFSWISASFFSLYKIVINLSPTQAFCG